MCDGRDAGGSKAKDSTAESSASSCKERTQLRVLPRSSGDIVRMHDGNCRNNLHRSRGRMILGDALSWRQRAGKPKGVIDLATLTGACVITPGN